MKPEEPCPCYVKTTIDGQPVDLYCEVGPAGHNGPHIGVASYNEHLSRRRAWREERNKQDEQHPGFPLGDYSNPDVKIVEEVTKVKSEPLS